MKLNRIIIITFIVSCLFLLLLTGLVWNSAMTNYVHSDIKENVISSSTQKASHLETYLEQLINQAKLVTSRTKLRATIASYTEEPTVQKQQTIYAILNDAQQSVDFIERIGVFDLDGVRISQCPVANCSENISYLSNFDSLKQEHQIYFSNTLGDFKLIVGGPMYYEDELVSVGLVVFSLDSLKTITQETDLFEDYVEYSILSIYHDDNVFFPFLSDVEKEQLIPFSQEIDALYKSSDESMFVQKDDSFLSLTKIKISSLGIITISDSNTYLKNKQSFIFTMTFLLLVGVLGVLIVISIILSNRIVKPLTKTTQQVMQITKGDLNVKLPKSSIAEIANLTSSLNRILASLKLAILRTGESKSSLGLGRVIQDKQHLEDLLTEVLNQNPFGIVIINESNQIVHFNDSYLELFALSEETALQLPNSINKEIKSLLSYVSKTKKSKQMQTTYSNDSSSGEKTLEIIAFPIADDKNKLVNVVVQFKDVTQENKENQELLKAKEQFEYLFENLNSGAAIYDVKKKGTKFFFASYNKEAARLDNASKKAVLGKDVEKIFPGIKKMGLLSLFKKVYTTGNPIDLPRAKYFDKEHGEFYRESHIFKLNSEQIATTYRDVTVQTRKELDLELFKEAFEENPNSIVLAKYEGKKANILHVNKAFKTFYGYSEKDAIGQTPAVLKSGKYSKKDYARLWKTVLDPKKGSWSGLIVNKTKKGKLLPVILTIKTIFDEKKKPIYFVASHMKYSKKFDELKK